MLYTGYNHSGPASVRYPRGSGPGVTVENKMTALPIGKAEILQQGNSVALLAFGSMVSSALTIGAELGATVVNMKFIVPLDETLIAEVATSHQALITIEENTISGGAGSAINETLHRHDINLPVLNIGLPNYYGEHGERDELLADCKLDLDGIRQQINQYLVKIKPVDLADKLSVG